MAEKRMIWLFTIGKTTHILREHDLDNEISLCGKAERGWDDPCTSSNKISDANCGRCMLIAQKRGAQIPKAKVEIQNPEQVKIARQMAREWITSPNRSSARDMRRHNGDLPDWTPEGLEGDIDEEYPRFMPAAGDQLRMTEKKKTKVA